MTTRANDVLVLTRFTKLRGPLNPAVSAAYIYGASRFIDDGKERDPLSWAAGMHEKYRINGYSDIHFVTICFIFSCSCGT